MPRFGVNESPKEQGKYVFTVRIRYDSSYKPVQFTYRVL